MFSTPLFIAFIRFRALVWKASSLEGSGAVGFFWRPVTFFFDLFISGYNSVFCSFVLVEKSDDRCSSCIFDHICPHTHCKSALYLSMKWNRGAAKLWNSVFKINWWQTTNGKLSHAWLPHLKTNAKMTAVRVAATARDIWTVLMKHVCI